MKTYFFAVFLGVILLLYFFLSEFSKPVKIFYFYNNKCIVANITDKIVSKAKEIFKNKVEITYFEVNMFLGDKPENNETTRLKEKYNVQGVPVLIINEKEYMGAYEFDKVIKEICNNFLVWPKECFIAFLSK